MKVIQRKICLLGDIAVGKTSLVRRFVEGKFDDKYLSTIGVKISRKTLEQPDSKLNLLIWDLAGGDDFSKAGASYLRGAAGALIVCDLTRPDTINAYHYYAEQLKEISPQAKLLFLGNKSDLEDKRRLTDEQLAEASQRWDSSYLLTSAKTGLNVEEAFQLLAQHMEGA